MEDLVLSEEDPAYLTIQSISTYSRLLNHPDKHWKDPTEYHSKRKQKMDEEELEVPPEAIFKAQVGMKDKEEIMELLVNESSSMKERMLALVAKPHGAKIPPIRVVASHLQKAWRFTKGVTIMPNKYGKNTLICLFCDPNGMKKVEEARAWSVRGMHIILGRWMMDVAIEDVVLDSVNFWVQIRGITPELLSEKSIKRVASRVGEVIDIDWKDSMLPKWFTIPRALVKVKVSEPLIPCLSINKKNGK